MSNPLVSCIIPTFNRADLLKNAIDSTLSQTVTDWELIIVDDGSVDNTSELVLSYCAKDKRIKYYKNPGKGGSSARNFGVSKAQGEYIAFLDDDDVSLPHRFQSQLSAAKKSGSGFIVSGYEVRDRSTNKLKSQVRLELKGMGAGFPSRWLLKKELFKKVNGFDEDFPSMQDIELSYRLAEHEVFVLHDDIVATIYPTKNSVSTNVNNAIRGKVLLMERLGYVMQPAEAAWWYFIIGTGYYSMGKKNNAIDCFKTAIQKRKNFNYKMCYYIAAYFPLFNNIAKKLVLKILHKLGNQRFPVLVVHPTIKQE